MTVATLLVELVTEELPPKALKKLGEAFAAAIADALRLRGFLAAGAAVTPFATPRRLSVAITEVAASITEPPRAVPLLPVNVAFDAGGTAHRRPREGDQGQGRVRELRARAGGAHRAPARWQDGARVLHRAARRRIACDPRCRTRSTTRMAKLPIPKVMSYAAASSYYNDVKFARPAHRAARAAWRRRSCL